jgi:hypothetical protein
MLPDLRLHFRKYEAESYAQFYRDRQQYKFRVIGWVNDKIAEMDGNREISISRCDLFTAA